MDPQERLFLQEVWKALENAGYTRARLHTTTGGQVGVFVGVTRAGHNLYGPARWQAGDTAYPFTSFGSIANRVSFKLDLNGPSMPIDTMCSSSLTALHEACEHLLRGDCEMALAGGVNLYLHPSSYVNLSALGMLSDDGRCHSFGDGGNGFVPGEGVGALVLKRLADAERDGDTIHAVIRGTAINHGGATNGYTVPNPVAQGEVIRKALDKAGVDARTIGYIEAHGTGTALGDPIEINGLIRAFAPDAVPPQSCALGSVKTNIGHAEAAAGIAGVCKVILQLQHGELVPSLHAEAVNPHLDLAATPFRLQQTVTPWPAQPTPRRAGVSSFGAGGANAHVVLEEYQATDVPADDTTGPQIVLLSAKDGDRLQERIRDLLGWLEQNEHHPVRLADLAHTLRVGREAMPDRLAVVVTSINELVAALRDQLNQPGGNAFRGRAGVLPDAEDLAELAASWLAKGHHAKLAGAWVRGLDIDWTPLQQGRHRIVALPGYPFARERYWIAEEPVAGELDALLDEVIDGYLSESLEAGAAAERLRTSLNTGRHKEIGSR